MSKRGISIFNLKTAVDFNAEEQRKNHPLSLITLSSWVATIVIYQARCSVDHARSKRGLGAETTRYLTLMVKPGIARSEAPISTALPLMRLLPK